MAKLILVHAVYLSSMPRASVTLKTKEIEKNMAEHAQEDIQLLCKKLQNNYPELSISYEIIHKEPLDEVIMTYAKYNLIDLIVMGTKGASGINKFLIGTNTSTIINKSNIPVIAVPEYAEYTGFKKILYASDLKNIHTELRSILPFAQKFQSSLTIMYVHRDNNEEAMDHDKLQSELQTTYNYKNLFVQVSIHKDIIVAIEEFINSWSPDMLVLFTHKLTLFENIFGKSITQEMSFRSKIPVFALKKNISTTF